MMKINIIAVLVAGLALTTSGWAVAHDNQNALLEVLIKKEDDIREKSTKIANLDVVIVEKDKELEADEKVIKKLNDQLQSKSEVIDEVKKNNEHLEKQLKEAEIKLAKKNERLALKKAEAKRIEQSKQVATNTKISTTTVSRGVESKKSITMVATGYIALCNTGCTGKTATGIDVRNTPSNQIIAVDPRVIPLHTKVKVTLQSGESFYARAEDTGGDIKGARIDILKATYSEAINFGNQRVTVTILN